MSRAELWFLILSMALLTFAQRASFLLAQDRIALPPSFRRSLRFVPPAVLAAIIAPAVVDLPLSTASLPRLAAGLVAALVAWRSRSILLTFAVGMGALWLVQLLLP